MSPPSNSGPSNSGPSDSGPSDSGPSDPGAPDPNAQFAPKQLTCPNCGQPRVHQFRPFCSKGCRDRDLIGWFDESYSIAGRPADEEGENRDGSAAVPEDG